MSWLLQRKNAQIKLFGSRCDLNMDWWLLIENLFFNLEGLFLWKHLFFLCGGFFINVNNVLAKLRFNAV